MPDTTLPITKRYYPKLSEVVTVDDLPEFLHFAQDGLSGLLDGIHYKNLQYSKSFRGDSAFYSLDIVSKNIGLGLPFGLRLVLNPDEDRRQFNIVLPCTKWNISGRSWHFCLRSVLSG